MGTFLLALLVSWFVLAKYFEGKIFEKIVFTSNPFEVTDLLKTEMMYLNYGPNKTLKLWQIDFYKNGRKKLFTL